MKNRTRHFLGRTLRVGLGATILLVLLSTAATAGTVIMGGSGENNGYPFTLSYYAGEYQQVYSASGFSGPVFINEIGFFGSPPAYGGGHISGTFSIHLSTTSAPVNGLSSTYADNIGPDNSLFFDGTVNNVLSFTGSPFLYDPSKGNLLMDVYVVSGSGWGALIAGPSTDSSRVFNWNGDGSPHFDTTTSLQTEFTVTGTPEPGSMMLLGSGLAILLGTARKLRR